MPAHGSDHPSPFWAPSACAAPGKTVTSEPAGTYQNFRKGRYQNFRNPHPPTEGPMKTTARLLLGALALALTLLTPSADVWAQQTGKVYRLGFLTFGSAPPEGVQVQVHYPWSKTLIRRLGERGYIEGKNLVIDYRWAESDYQRVAPLSENLVRSGVDVIFTGGTKMGRIVQEAVKNTPLVVYSCDPFEHVARLARQGGNVTGVTCMTTELSPKRLELLKEAIPKASRVVFLHDPDDAPIGLKLTQEAAPA